MTKKRKYDSVPRELPRFDPAESLRLGLELLKEADVPFALAGRLAVWTYVPPAAHQFTKDVDFAVPYGHTDRVAAAARDHGYEVSELSIGGYGVRARKLLVDFIDRHPHLSRLFADAVKAAKVQQFQTGEDSIDLPIVPLHHLVAMKLVSAELLDDRDVEELLMKVPEEEYRDLHQLVTEYLGYASAQRLDSLARRIGHPGPGMKRRYNNSDEAGKDSEENA